MLGEISKGNELHI